MTDLTIDDFTFTVTKVTGNTWMTATRKTTGRTTSFYSPDGDTPEARMKLVGWANVAQKAHDARVAAEIAAGKPVEGD